MIETIQLLEGLNGYLGRGLRQRLGDRERPELVERRAELALRSETLPDELLSKRTLHGIPIVAREDEAPGRMRCVVREDWGVLDDEVPF